MLVLVIEAGEQPKRKEIDGSLESLQKEVGGYIEAVYPYNDPIALVCDEEGKIKRKEPNRPLCDSSGFMYDFIAGTFLVVGLGEDDFTSLTDELAKKYEQMFSM